MSDGRGYVFLALGAALAASRFKSGSSARLLPRREEKNKRWNLLFHRSWDIDGPAIDEAFPLPLGSSPWQAIDNRREHAVDLLRSEIDDAFGPAKEAGLSFEVYIIPPSDNFDESYELQGSVIAPASWTEAQVEAKVKEVLRLAVAGDVEVSPYQPDEDGLG